MPVTMEGCLLEEASRVAGREVGRNDVLHGHLNINKLLIFLQRFYRRTGVELDVNSFFVWPTIGELAERLDSSEPVSIPKMLLLKDGDRSRPLFLFAGGVSCFHEIKGILEGVDHSGAVYGMCLSNFQRPHSSPATVDEEVAACLQELEDQKIKGPISLVGYSFGGIVALELARALRERGKDVRFLGLVDTQQSEHTWPFAVWTRHVTQRIARKARKVFASRGQSKTPVQPSEAVDPRDLPAPQSRLLYRLRPLCFRFCSPKHKSYHEMAPEWIWGLPPAYGSVGEQLLRMQGLYRPRPYDGPLVYYKAQSGSPTHCDPWHIWGRHLPNAEWVEVRGNHLSAIVGRNGAAIGADISRRIAEPAVASGGLRAAAAPVPVAQPVST